MNKLVLLVSLALVGCVHTSVRAITGPDGETLFEASCSGNHASFGDCMAVAAQICEGPYEIVDKDSSMGVGNYNKTLYSKTYRQMMFRCEE